MSNDYRVPVGRMPKGYRILDFLRIETREVGQIRYDNRKVGR